MNWSASWSTSVRPLNKGRPAKSSPNTAPALNTSTQAPYDVEPRSTSGARYHRVTIWGVMRPLSETAIMASQLLVLLLLFILLLVLLLLLLLLMLSA